MWTGRSCLWPFWSDHPLRYFARSRLTSTQSLTLARASLKVLKGFQQRFSTFEVEFGQFIAFKNIEFKM